MNVPVQFGSPLDGKGGGGGAHGGVALGDGVDSGQGGLPYVMHPILLLFIQLFNYFYIIYIYLFIL